MTGPANSPVSDPLPSQMPDVVAKKNKVRKSDWARLGTSRKYKDVDSYIHARKEYFQHFLPGGESFAALYIKDPEAAARWAACVSVIYDELDTLQFRIQSESGK